MSEPKLEPDTIWRIQMMEPPEDGDPDKPYRPGRTFEFRIAKSLTTSAFIVTDPDGFEHVCAEPEDEARVVARWLKTRGKP